MAFSADSLITFSGTATVLSRPPGQPALFLADYDATTGALNGVTELGAPALPLPAYARANPRRLRLTPDGLYVGGSYSGSFRFGPAGGGNQTSTSLNPSADGFVAKYAPNSPDCQWVIDARSEYAVDLTDIVALPNGPVVAGGGYFYTLTLGPYLLNSSGAFVGRITQRVLGRAAEGAAAAGLAAWPNPARGAVQVQWAAQRQAGALRLHDGLGRVVRQRATVAGQAEAAFDVSGLAPGVYVLRSPGGASQRLAVAP